MIKKLLAIFILSSSFTFAQNALNFDGVNDFVNTTYPGISGSSPRTVEAWIKTTANAVPANGGVQQTIVDWGTFATGQRFTFNILFNNAIRLEAQGNGLSGTIPVNDGNWHHVATVYDPNAANKVSLYVDGVLDVAGNLTVTVNTGSTLPVRIGKRIDENNSFAGSIDEVRIWNIAKTQAEIQEAMNVELCVPQPSLKAYYKFNQGTAGGTNSAENLLTDSSGNNYTGTLSNFALTGTTSNWITSQTLPTATVDNSITNDNAGTLSSLVTGATYQWMDCTNSNTPVSGATFQTFSPATVGNYAVQISKNGCTATSVCETVASILNNSSNGFSKSISMHPNPSNGITNIQLSES